MFVIIFFLFGQILMPSVLWRCWLGGRKGIRPVKNWVVGCWRGICLEQGADLHFMVQLMPLPLTVSCSSKIQIGFIFLVPAHLGSPGKRAVKRVCVCVCVVRYPSHYTVFSTIRYYVFRVRFEADRRLAYLLYWTRKKRCMVRKEELKKIQKLI